MDIRDFVEVHVHQGINRVVDALAKGDPTSAVNPPELRAMIEQAGELTYPVDDWESAAFDEGWRDVTDTAEFPERSQFKDTTDGQVWACKGWRELCEAHDIEPFMSEPYEYWIVSDWLADELESRDEKVDRDFAGLTVWARCSTGQHIMLDAVIEGIHADLCKRMAA